MPFYSWAPYVSVGERRAKARREMDKLRKKGKDIQPIEIEGRKIALSFWGKGWCDHLESFSDFENRLPRGRTYVRNGSVCHLEIRQGEIEAYVSGSSLYKVNIKITPIVTKIWEGIKTRCRGQVGSVLELLQGRLSNHVMGVVCDRDNGLFPRPGEIEMHCSCPDWAVMCKHVAAVLYGVGSRLDSSPELLFLLRVVDAAELITADIALQTDATADAAEVLAQDGLADIFGVDIDAGAVPPRQKAKTSSKSSKTSGAKTKPESKRGAAAKTSAAANKKSAKKTTRKKNFVPAFDPKAPTGAAIAHLHKKTKLSKLAFARALGVSVPTVQRWENTDGPLRIQARPLMALSEMQKKYK